MKGLCARERQAVSVLQDQLWQFSLLTALQLVSESMNQQSQQCYKTGIRSFLELGFF